MSYRYSLLSFYKALGDDSSSIPLAVLTEGMIGNEKCIVVMGQAAVSDQIKDLDIVSRKIIERSKELLDSQLTNIAKGSSFIL